MLARAVVVQHDMPPCAGMGGGGPLQEAQAPLVAVPGARSSFPRGDLHGDGIGRIDLRRPPGPRLVRQRGDRARPAAAPLADTVGREASAIRAIAAFGSRSASARDNRGFSAVPSLGSE